MAAEMITPVDELTGMPLSVATPLQDLSRHKSEVANWHHLYHPSTALELQSLGGNALRNSRVQLLPVRQHNTGKYNYHTYYKGPLLPLADDEVTQFRLCVLSCAGYLPDKVIDMQGAVPVERLMTAGEFKYLRRAPLPEKVTSVELRRYLAIHELARGKPLGDMEVKRLTKEGRAKFRERNETQAILSDNNFRYAYEPIRDFFKDYALRQPLDHLSEPLVDEFLHTKKIERHHYLGHLLLTEKSEVATESFETQYRDAHRAGRLHPLMPVMPHNLVDDKLGNRAYKEEIIFPEMAERLLLSA